MPVTNFNGETSFAGRTLARYSESVRVMSDVWEDRPVARVLATDGSVLVVSGQGVVDASPEIVAAAAAVSAAEESVGAAKFALSDLKRASVEITAGIEVEVFKKRAKGSGTVGRVFWVGASRFGTRVGMNVAGSVEPFWTAIGNVKPTAAETARWAEFFADAENEIEVAVAALFKARARAAGLVAERALVGAEVNSAFQNN